jgi:putative phosphoesterase
MTALVRIGVIADTHMPPFNDSICAAVEEAFAGVELVLHAGDLVSRRVIEWLEGIAPVVVARGNNDMHLETDEQLADVHLLELAGVRVGMTHVLPVRRGDDPPSVPDLARSCGLDPVPDVWIFGDSHREVVEWRDGVLLLNPGSPTSPHLRVDLPGRVAVLTIDGGRPSAEIVHLPVPGQPGARREGM